MILSTPYEDEVISAWVTTFRRWSDVFAFFWVYF